MAQLHESGSTSMCTKAPKICIANCSVNRRWVFGESNPFKNLNNSPGDVCASQTRAHATVWRSGDEKDYRRDIDSGRKRPNLVHETDLIYKHGCWHTRVICKFQYKMIIRVDTSRQEMEVIVNVS